ncbi:MAG: dihydrolipoyl dehydrogenase [Candidatus Atribacteria bacterium]|nr:dihydrolipoyl dehydrogenase [Candidatus Atribacteria bacterium]
MKKTDLVVIGGGPAGYAAAIRAGQKGMKTLLIESRDIGGTCLNRGCIPTKAFFRSQEVFHLSERAAEFGIQVKIEGVDWPKVLARKNKVVKQLTGGVRFLLRKAGVEIVDGIGSFLDNRTIEFIGKDEKKESIQAKHILIATGSKSAQLPVPGAGLEGVIDSDQMLDLPSIPEKLVVIGGGYIGMEMACILNKFGTQVEVVEMLPNILPIADSEVVKLFIEILEKRDMKIHTSAKVVEISKDKKLKVSYEQNGEMKLAEGDYVLVATGRVPMTDNLYPEKAGIEMDKNAVIADLQMKTSVPSIYAAGDVNGKYLLAHVAFKEAEVAINNLMGKPAAMDYRVVPNCIFCSPEISSVGLTEEEALASGFDVKIGKFPFRAVGKALIEGETEGFVKIIADQKTGEILGAHIIGPHASDLIGEMTLAMALESTPEEIAHTIHPHPTLTETVMEAADSVFGTSLHLF